MDIVFQESSDGAMLTKGASEPFAINVVDGRFMIYSADAIMYIRKAWHMCGCLFGTLPQVPQQNVFLGLPLELMEEEAALLVEKGVAVLIDDELSHVASIHALSDTDKLCYLGQLRDEQEQAMRATAEATELKKKRFVAETSSPAATSMADEVKAPEEGDEAAENSETLFLVADENAGARSERGPSPSKHAKSNNGSTTHFSSTPATVSSLTGYTPKISSEKVKPVSSKFALYKHMHARGYFLSPGLRFGCEFLAYPDDPLRFHSHFLANSFAWEDEFQVMDLVGGGRLGTGVKKSWLVGGPEPGDNQGNDDDRNKSKENEAVRCFSIEWSGFG